MEAYEDMIRHTATEDAPWYVVPADNKWFTRVVVAAAVIETLASLDLKYPKVGAGQAQRIGRSQGRLIEKIIGGPARMKFNIHVCFGLAVVGRCSAVAPSGRTATGRP